MTKAVELRVLGPLAASRGGDPLPLGGAKQRVVLATLLVRAGEVVSTDALVDEVWHEAPPQSAHHGLEAYVSRLRQLFSADELTISRTGSGYSLAVGSAWLDSHELDQLAADAERAAREGDHRSAVATATAALSLYRGPVLDAAGSGAIVRSEAARLEDLRLRMLEHRFDAELALGRHAEIVGELQAGVARYPFREQLVAQLMLALYRCGRHTDALTAYEELRRRLDSELGLRPSTQLQQLSARIVRHEPLLGEPVTAPPEQEPAGRHPARRTRRTTTMILAAAAVIAATALSASGGEYRSTRADRVALVLPADPARSIFDESADNSRLRSTAEGFSTAVSAQGLPSETMRVAEAGADEGDVVRLLSRIRHDRIGLVLLPGDRDAARLVAPHVARHPETRFVFLDTTLAQLSLQGVPNATAVRYVSEQPARMAGVAGGLVLARGVFGPRDGATIAVVAAVRDVETRRMVDGFERGVHLVLPGARVRVGYTGESDLLAPCERLANQQIDGGAQLVFIVAQTCGRGAAAVAHARGIPAIGEDEYGLKWTVATVFKDWSQGATQAIDAFVAGALPGGGDLELGVEDDYATGLGMGSAIPDPIQSQVVELCTRIRLREEAGQRASSTGDA